MKMVHKSKFIGRISQRSRETVRIYEDNNYVQQILQEFGMTDSKETSTPAAPTTTLTTEGTT